MIRRRRYAGGRGAIGRRRPRLLPNLASQLLDDERRAPRGVAGADLEGVARRCARLGVVRGAVVQSVEPGRGTFGMPAVVGRRAFFLSSSAVLYGLDLRG